MKRTLIATAAALALGFSGVAMANPCSDNSDSAIKGQLWLERSDCLCNLGSNGRYGRQRQRNRLVCSVSQDSFNKVRLSL